jgi:hypothetical protein
MDTTATLDSFQTIDFAQLDMVTGGAFSWGDFGRAVGGGAIAGGLGGAAAGAITGPGAGLGALGGFVGGAITGGVYNAGQQLGAWK